MDLLILFCITSVAGSLGITIGTQISGWWMVALIPALFVGCIVLYMLYIVICTIFLPRKEPKKSSAFCRVNIQLFLDFMFCLFRVKFHITGEDKLPNEPIVLVSNHRSVFDPMAVLAKTKRKKMLFISKHGNFKIPLAGPFIRRAGFLPIDRENGMRALRTLKTAADRMQQEGADYGIYPEGTRSKSGELQEFKSGAFYLAKKAEAPVAVMVVRNTEKVGKCFPIHRTHIYMDYIAVIDKETVAAKSMEELALMTHDMIESYWNQTT